MRALDLEENHGADHGAPPAGTGRSWPPCEGLARGGSRTVGRSDGRADAARSRVRLPVRPPGYIANAAPPEVPIPSPLALVSNRLPFAAERRAGRLTLAPAPGGLVTALRGALAARGGRWVGWPGVSSEELARAGGLPLPADRHVAYVPVPLSAAEVSEFYGQFANRTLWPLFHYFVEHARVDRAAWPAYERVNERFAEAAAAAAPADATIWIHDYQLLRTPAHLRARRPGATIAFFLHIPFPAADVFRILPWSRALLRGMLGADYVGFHTASYAAHFLTSVERLLGGEVDWSQGTVQVEGREVATGVHPVGIPVAATEERARAALARPAARRADGVREILGVDRLDYTKGIRERLLAVERLLERHPEYRGRIVFTQVAVPSRERVAEYGRLKREVDETVGRINGRFSEEGWSPVRYLARSLDQVTLAGLYARADVALVTPLRDGMNLVAKEYVASQVGPEPGMLVLSELAGAAEALQEAVMVNPFDIDGVADAIHGALAMPAVERRARMAALRDRVRELDVTAWADGFLAAAEAAAGLEGAGPSPADTVARRLAPWLAARPRTALFLDYDGTLTEIVDHPEAARLGPQALDALQRAASAQHLDVTVVSGRALDDLRTRVPVPGVTLVGNHGFEIEGPGLHWHHPEAGGARVALAEAVRRLEALGEPNTWVEDKGVTLSWHLRSMPEQARARAERRGAAVLERLGLRAVPGKAVLEARPPLEWHKGLAVLQVLRARYGDEWTGRVRAMYVGDDQTDEDAFRSLAGLGRSLRVGDSQVTAATDRLPDPEAVTALVRWLAAGPWLGPPA
ncbi:MAG TPA: bifunctional alpha,alpha-trehalose-phosphate synthase (UDP-forming)/trehalose-phosphatase [Gemmatimonadales bacterium]|nr:bifunctional alpha,alpha-trehalose-phosphate synthase (UDP-forming)/trehalose-phosphatase [Gemmatimonadales bacterium]